MSGTSIEQEPKWRTNHGGTWAIKCPCGWLSDYYPVRQPAKAAFARHCQENHL